MQECRRELVQIGEVIVSQRSRGGDWQTEEEWAGRLPTVDRAAS